ncbi:hypothetical protein IEO21_06211 [Rhodonia placenta]|uniref:Uncharacterized protein n=1 Tax=Rhodonia placenta TaxID=104341 RepID=A0A8H7P0R5_9APHY|nr:hypothetical protein IEO21_06211 [Postia placenta]
MYVPHAIVPYGHRYARGQTRSSTISPAVLTYASLTPPRFVQRAVP